MDVMEEENLAMFCLVIFSDVILEITNNDLLN